MQARVKRGVAILTATATVAAGAGATGALAEGPGKGSPGAKHGTRHHGARGVLKAVAAYVGVTPKALRAELRAGKSLAQIAGDQSKSVDGLKQAILSVTKARLDKAVGAGRLSADDAKARLAKLESKLDTLVNKTRPAK